MEAGHQAHRDLLIYPFQPRPQSYALTDNPLKTLSRHNRLGLMAKDEGCRKC
jgi:hypothetical protein